MQLTTNNTGTFTYTGSTTFTLSAPKVEGYWCIAPNVKIAIQKVPNKFHRFMMKLVFGWTFELAETQTTTRQMLHG